MASGAPTAGLPAKDGTVSQQRLPAVLSTKHVHQSRATARPHYGTELIDAADRKNETDPAIRARNDWL